MAYDRVTGKKITDYLINIKQQIAEILQTPKMTRVGPTRREYGTEFYKLVDKPITLELQREAVRMAYEALANQLPQVQIVNISIPVKTNELNVYIEFEVNNQVSSTTVNLG